MELSRRQILKTTAAMPIVMAFYPAAGTMGMPLASVTPHKPITIHRLHEFFGDGDYGNLMGLYADGHVDPLRMVQRIDVDDVVAILGEDIIDAKTGDFLNEDAVNTDLAGRVKHLYVEWRPSDCECDEPAGCDYCAEHKTFHTHESPGSGLKPVTVLDI